MLVGSNWLKQVGMIFTTGPRPSLNLPKLYAKRRQHLLAWVWKLNSQACNIFFLAHYKSRHLNNLLLKLYDGKHLRGSDIDVCRGLFYAFAVCRSCSTYLHCTAVDILSIFIALQFEDCVLHIISAL